MDEEKEECSQKRIQNLYNEYEPYLKGLRDLAAFDSEDDGLRSESIAD